MKKSSNAAMIAVICAVVVIAFSVAAVMFARGNSSTGGDDDSPSLGPLPDAYIGIWELPADSHALQSPRNADMSEDDAIADEYDFGVTMTYGEFSTNRVGGIRQPSYKLTKDCGAEAMDEYGMQSDGIMDEFKENASVDKIEIWNTDETELCDTVFVIDNEYLVYFGSGNFVFCAVKLDAMG